MGKVLIVFLVTVVVYVGLGLFFDLVMGLTSPPFFAFFGYSMGCISTYFLTELKGDDNGLF